MGLKGAERRIGDDPLCSPETEDTVQRMSIVLKEVKGLKQCIMQKKRQAHLEGYSSLFSFLIARQMWRSYLQGHSEPSKILDCER